MRKATRISSMNLLVMVFLFLKFIEVSVQHEDFVLKGEVSRGRCGLWHGINEDSKAFSPQCKQVSTNMIELFVLSSMFYLYKKFIQK